MAQNTKDESLDYIIVVTVLMTLLPSLYIISKTGASFDSVFKGVVSTIIIILTIGVFKYYMSFVLSTQKILLVLALIISFWKEALYSSAFNYVNPNYAKNDVFSSIGEQRIAWWGENWFFYMLEVILIGLAIFFWYRDRQRPY